MPGKLIAFLTALVMAYQPVRGLAAMNASLQEGLAAAQRIFDMIDHRPSIVDAPDAQDLTETITSVSFDGVTFAYPGTEVNVLNNVN